MSGSDNLISQANIVVPGDIIIGPNGSVYQSGRTHRFSIGTSDDTPLNMAVQSRGVATAETLKSEIETFPQRVVTSTEMMQRMVQQDNLWRGSTPNDVIETHGDIAFTVLTRDIGLSEKEANQIAAKYKEAIKAEEQTDLEKIKASTAGYDVIAQGMRQKIAQVMSCLDLNEAVAYAPLNHTVYLLDMNGQLKEGDGREGAQARLYTQENLRAPFATSSLASAMDDLRYFAKDTTNGVMDSFFRKVSSSDFIQQNEVKQDLVNQLANSLKLAADSRETFCRELVDQLSHASYGKGVATTVRDIVDTQIDKTVERLPTSTTSYVEQAHVLREKEYLLFQGRKKAIEPEIIQALNGVGHTGVTGDIRFEVSQGTSTFGGGFTGAETRTHLGSIAVSHILIDDWRAGRLSSENVQSHLREEIRHTIDLKYGISGKPEWQAYVNALYEDPQKQEAWKQFAVSKNKSPPSYYKEYGGLEMEFLADLLDMEEKKTAEVGLKGARRYIEKTFGKEAVAFIDDFHATANRGSMDHRNQAGSFPAAQAEVSQGAPSQNSPIPDFTRPAVSLGPDHYVTLKAPILVGPTRDLLAGAKADVTGTHPVLR